MIRIFRVLLLAALPFLAVSCFKEDERVLPHEPGTALSDTVALTSSYKYQVYFNLSTQSAAYSALKDNWDLGFESAPGGFRIRLNTSCFMYAADAGPRDILIPADTTGVKWYYDKSDGDQDSTAVREWFVIQGKDTIGNGHAYFINRGLNDIGAPRGYRQVIFDSLSNGTYYFRVSGFSGGTLHAYSVKKDPTVNMVLFSFESGSSAVEKEPFKNSWDLLFSQYTTLLYTDEGDPYPYLVTGVLLNPESVEAVMDTVNSFEAITFEIAKNTTLSRAADVIGYYWKYYDFDTGAYTVAQDKVYIIRDHTGAYYKLRFTGFYNRLGEKGYPSFEYQRL